MYSSFTRFKFKLNIYIYNSSFSRVYRFLEGASFLNVDSGGVVGFLGEGDEEPPSSFERSWICNIIDFLLVNE